MISKIRKELLEQGLLTPEKRERVEKIAAREIVSVYYDLRALLCVGVLLLSTGIGILIYENISDAGHLVAIGVLILITAGCFVYVFRKGPPYSHGVVEGPTPYFDYVVLLGSLLFISVQGYLQFQYDLLTENMGMSTLISALLFFFVAYRFDHIGVLSLGITSLASFFSITISPKKWYNGDFLEGPHVYLTAVIFGVVLAAVALLLERRQIKPHFLFTYLNFALLIFFAGAISGLFESRHLIGLYIPVIYAGVLFAYLSAKKRKSFLFLLYAFIAGYIATTYLLAETILVRADESLWFYYFLFSSGGFVYLIIKYRKHFTRA
jgi:hypothetical protein